MSGNKQSEQIEKLGFIVCAIKSSNLLITPVYDLQMFYEEAGAFKPFVNLRPAANLKEVLRRHLCPFVDSANSFWAR